MSLSINTANYKDDFLYLRNNKLSKNESTFDFIKKDKMF
jgi:hypothetical protein